MKTIQALWLFILLTIMKLSPLVAQVFVPATGNHTFKFSVKTNPPPTVLTPLKSTATNPAPHYLVFINTGDGHYFTGDYLKNASGSTDLSKFVYTYPTISQAAVYNPYVEFVEVYDDGNPPGRSSVGSTSTSYVSAQPVTAAATPQILISTPLQLSSVRKVVPNHANTYVVTVKNTNPTGGQTWSSPQIKFTYNTDFFILDPTWSVAAANPELAITAITGPASTSNPKQKMITVTFPALAAGKQINLFFSLKTLGLTVNSIAQKPAVDLFNGPQFITRIGPSDVLVEKAHDPNLKTPFLTTVSATGVSIEYRIDFQNDGPADANHLHITDELDNYLSADMPVITGASFNTSLVRTTKIDARVWQWNIDNIVLMGTSNPAYTVDKAKGFIQFKVQVDRISSCQSIVNRARIVFECNPPVYTNFAYTRIPCNGATVDTCQEELSNYWLPTISNVQPGATLDHLLGANLINNWSNNSVFSCKWYPARQLNSALDPATGVKMAQPETYVLVAARACQRNIVYVTVGPGGHTDDSAILVGDAPGDCQANLDIIGGTPPYKYIWSWNEGPIRRGGNQRPPLVLTNKTNVQVTVTDSLGCTVTFSPWPGNCPIGPGGNWFWGVIGAAVVAAGVGLYAWRKKKLA